MYCCDIAIIGGGASALAAAVEAARAGAFVCILERLPRVGKKLLVTGNGRCNLSNENISAGQYFGSQNPQSIFDKFGNIKEFFASMGLYTRTDGAGRIYPMSNTASSVLDALRLECARLGVIELCSFEAAEIKNADGKFHVISADGKKVMARRIIFAFGGKAAPSLGTDGSAFKLLSEFGIKFSAPSPALAPLNCRDAGLLQLKGLRVMAGARAYRGGTLAGTSLGEVQFTENALSGICVFDLSCHEPDTLELDLLPEFSKEEVLNMLLCTAKIRADTSLENAFTGIFNKRIACYMLKRTVDIPLSSPCGELRKNDLKRLSEEIKCLRFSVCGSSFEKAQATRGGILASELSDSLQLKKLPGAYACGECIDVLGICGGFNLHWAWASGRCAGSFAAESLR